MGRGGRKKEKKEEKKKLGGGWAEKKGEKEKEKEEREREKEKERQREREKKKKKRKKHAHREVRDYPGVIGVIDEWRWRSARIPRPIFSAPLQDDAIAGARRISRGLHL